MAGEWRRKIQTLDTTSAKGGTRLILKARSQGTLLHRSTKLRNDGYVGKWDIDRRRLFAFEMPREYHETISG